MLMEDRDAGPLGANAAHAALLMTLLGKDEDRFPYLTFDYPDDEVLGDDADDWRAGGDA